jgi:hypothetical protein
MYITHEQKFEFRYYSITCYNFTEKLKRYFCHIRFFARALSRLSCDKADTVKYTPATAALTGIAICTNLNPLLILADLLTHTLC